MMARTLVAAVLVWAVACAAVAMADGDAAPLNTDNLVFVETFEDGAWDDRWIFAVDEMYGGNVVVDTAKNNYTGDSMLVLDDKAARHGITTVLPAAIGAAGQDLVIQYEVQLLEKHECGGAYLKFLRTEADFDAADMVERTPFSIMFGPDACGFDNEKVHFIFQHQNPVTGEWEEKHMTNQPKPAFADSVSHLYTLHIHPNNDFEIYVDQEQVRAGTLLDDFDPPVNPPKEIDDPEDFKPEDWDDDEYIPDPEAAKPDDWDEDAPAMIEDPDDEKPEGWLDDAEEWVPDEDAEQPDDWSDEDDGEWEAPLVRNPVCEEIGCGEWTPRMIVNPEYKGKWSAPMIINENYSGVWKPKRIPNPAFFTQDDVAAHIAPIGAIAVEIWTMTRGIAYDNIIITHDLQAAIDFAAQTWAPKYDAHEAVRAAERAAIEGPGLMAQITEAIEMVVQGVNENPLVGVVGVGVTFVALSLVVYVCCCSGGIDEDDHDHDHSHHDHSHDDKKDDGDNEGEAGDDNDDGDDDGAGATADAKTSKTSPKKRKTKKET